MTFGHLLLRMVVVGAVSVAAAYVSRKYFEDRFLRLKD
jgi:peptidoglycan/LPS O-acetylase OafA/YrhL